MKKPDNQSNKTTMRFTLGLKRFAKIIAVEGLQLSRDMRRDFTSFERDGLSDEDRRRKLSAKYGKKSF